MGCNGKVGAWAGLTWIVGSEAIDHVALCLDDDDVATYRVLRRVCRVAWVCALGSYRTFDHLEIMSMHMDWVGASVVVIDDDLDNIVVINYVRVRIDAIDDWISRLVAGAEDCHESRNVLRDVGRVVDQDSDVRVRKQVANLAQLHTCSGHLRIQRP